jgi:hypothetical protein
MVWWCASIDCMTSAKFSHLLCSISALFLGRSLPIILSIFVKSSSFLSLYFTVPHGFPWTAHGLLIVLMECSWTAHGLLMDLMECLWTAHGLPMDCSWTAHGVHEECSWSAHGVCGVLMDCSWSPWALWYVWYNLPCRSVIASTFVLGSLTLDFGWTMISFGEIYPL